MSNEYSQKYNDFIDTYDRIFNVKTGESYEEIANLITSILINKYKECFKDIILSILTAIEYDYYHIRLYLKILNQILEIHSLKFRDFLKDNDIKDLAEKLDIFISTRIENHVTFNRKRYPNKDDIHYIIMHDQIDKFKEYISQKSIDRLCFKLPIFSGTSFSPIEECCLFGCVNIFYFLISNFKTEISENCLKYAFAGNNTDIINECLKNHQVNDECIDFIIYSHKNASLQYIIDRDLYQIDRIWNLEDKIIKSRNLKAAFILYDKDKNSVIPWCAAFPQFNEIVENEQLDFSRTISGKTILHYAALFNNSDIFKVLTKAETNKININSCDNADENSALHIALLNNYTEIAKILISRGANVNLKNKQNKNPLLIAFEKKNEEVAELLIKSGAKLGIKLESGLSALHYAVLNNWLNATKLLIPQSKTLNPKNKSHETPLHFCVRYGHREIAELLLSHGAKFTEKNKQGETPLHLCAKFNRSEIARLLFSYGNIKISDRDPTTPIHIAAEKGSIEIAKVLIENGAEINGKKRNGDTLALCAARNNQAEFMQFLISIGADIYTKSSKGKTPLHLAAQSNGIALAEILLNNGANINEKDDDGQTALHIAARYAKKEMVEFLLSHGANVRAKTKNKETALHISSKLDKKEISDLLISHRADLYARDIDGRTPQSYITGTNNYPTTLHMALRNRF